MTSQIINLSVWRTGGPHDRMFLNTYVNHDNIQEVYVFKHKAVMLPRHRGPPDHVHVHAFLPDYGLWRDLNKIHDKTLMVPPDVQMLAVRYADVLFCPGFGVALTKASGPYNNVGVVWPPETEGQNIIVHGVGTRIIRVVFWREDRGLPTEFAIRMDHSTNVEPVLYDALTTRLNYSAEIDIWNVGRTEWWRLPNEVSWELNPKYSSVCIRASEGVGFTPGLGWEIAQLERQHGRDVAIDVPGYRDDDE